MVTVYLRPTIGGDEAYRKKHANVLERKPAYLGCSTDELDKHALQESYRDHLLDFGLLTRHLSRAHRSKQPEFDTFTGELKVSCHDASPLKCLLLWMIGIADERFEKKGDAEPAPCTGRRKLRL